METSVVRQRVHAATDRTREARPPRGPARRRPMRRRGNTTRSSSSVAVPLFRQVANVLRAEGYRSTCSRRAAACD